MERRQRPGEAVSSGRTSRTWSREARGTGCRPGCSEAIGERAVKGLEVS